MAAKKSFVKDYMTKNVISVSPDTLTEEVIELMRESNHNSYPVVENDKVVGMVTAFDIVSKPWADTVKGIMSTNLVVANQELSINDASRVMFRRGISRMPVVNEEGKFENSVTSDTSEQNVAGVGGANLETLQHMEEVKIKIDEMLPDGFVGTIEVGNDLFKAGEQITIIAQDNVTVVQKDGSIFAYDELEPNIPDSDLAIGSSVWVGFQKYDYVEGNGKYNQIFAYHIAQSVDEME